MWPDGRLKFLTQFGRLVSTLLVVLPGIAVSQIITTVAGGGSGSFAGNGGPAVAAVLQKPAAVAVDRAGNIYISEEQTGRIRRVDASTGIITIYAGTGGLTSSGDGGPATSASIWKAIDLAFDSSGNLLLLDTEGGAGSIRKVDASTGTISLVYRNPGSNGVLSAFAASPNGRLYLASTTRIVSLDPDSGATEVVAGNGRSDEGGDEGPALSVSTGYVQGMVVDANENIFLALNNICRVTRYDSATRRISLFAGKPCPDPNGVAPPPGIGDGGPAIGAQIRPRSLALDSLRNLFIGEVDRIRRVDAQTGVISTFAGGNNLFVTNDGAQARNAMVAPVWSPGALAFDAGQNMYVADWHVFYGGRIRKISGPPLTNATGLWWNPTESGWGINFNHQGDILFGTLFTYDASGAPMWLVMSAGRWQTGSIYSGDLYRTTGPAFDANPFLPIGGANLTRVGTMSVAFIGSERATLSYAVDGISVSKAIEKLVFGARAANCLHADDDRASATNYQDLWWNPAESGWGVNVAHQGNTIFATLFTYDAAGNNLWLVLSAGIRQPDGSFAGDLYRTTGPRFNASPFTPIGPANLANVGTMTFRFSRGDSGTLTYVYQGVTVMKQISRMVFSSPVPSCS